MDINKSIAFIPLSPILLVSSNGISELPLASITPDKIGLKAYGLACLPKAWTCPFVVISDELIEKYADCNEEQRKQLLSYWIENIIKATQRVGINVTDSIIVRSSACSEGLEERGKHTSNFGALSQISVPLEKCLKAMTIDSNHCARCMSLVVQKYVDPISAKGHLSNERRCYKETRDWMGEVDQNNDKPSAPFKINLRQWREKITTANKMEYSLKCNLSPHIQEILKIPATWIASKKIRVHFEWVWDGKNIYLVQADQEQTSRGADPTKIDKSRIASTGFTPRCLVEITDNHAERYAKIHNVIIYRKLGLPTIKLYILDDQKTIDALAKDNSPSELKNDLDALVRSSLVIRMDTTSYDISSRQLLPRTNELRNANQAIAWLKEHSKLNKKLPDIAFIFHNFIPSISSAFAYAAPNERKVMIEALWGVPEGLYYNAHDKYIVDTLSPRKINEPIGVNKFLIHRTLNYKKYFITPNNDGKWTTQMISPPHDWRDTIAKSEWLQQIALHSRRIAETEGKPLSIMWFVGIPNTICKAPILPWHHEPHDLSVSRRDRPQRKKTPFDTSLIIKTSNELEELRKETQMENSSLRCIRIQPSEDKLLRDKETLSVIGDLAKKIGATVLLEGGVLSHAYYQLTQTGATVEILHPFNESDEKQEFNKLVRDKIPSIIENGGEFVKKISLDKESHLRALREKLIEEAIEVLDAIDQDSIINEIADVKEVIEGIVHLLEINEEELKNRQSKKRDKTGGFRDGVVLLETMNPLPTKKELHRSSSLFPDIEPTYTHASVILGKKNRPEYEQDIYKKSDKREHEAATEILLKVRIPIVRDRWTASTPETDIGFGSANTVVGRLKGKRLGEEYEIELSIYSERKQLLLFRDE